MQTIKGCNIKFLTQNSKDIIETILFNRGILQDDKTLEQFFNPSFSDLHDPYLFDGMNDAVNRILKAKNDKERVVIFGDYDVDGISSTAILSRFFSEIGIEVSYRLPHRINDGYGLKNYFVDELLEKNVKLLITVDCGTRDLDVISYAKKLGIDVIITDHHFVPENNLQDTVAFINPKLANSKYPNNDLSGSGVAFKLLQAIAKRLFKNEEYMEVLGKYIDFAMLGTIADCMPLIGENRAIAYLGLKQLKNSSSSGLKKLIEGHNGDDLDSNIVGFKIGPKLNAAGRMDSPYKALKVLLAGEKNIIELVEEIEGLNSRRKTSTEFFLKKAYEEISNDNNVIFYDSSEITHGVIGLIAGKLSDTFNKVAIVLRDEDDRLIASCRCPEYINIIEILEEFKDLFIVFGGHHQAAGFTILKENFILFKEKIEAKVTKLTEKVDKTKWINIDAKITLDQVNFEFLEQIEKLKPFGCGNTKPLFFIDSCKIFSVEFLGREEKHLKIITNTGIDIKAFGFGIYYGELKNKKSLSLIVEIERNIWNGRESISLNVVDII